jgi:hypothetical protein
MNNLRPVDLKDPRIKTQSSSSRAGKKLIIGLLVVLIVSVMIVWIGFIGWGVLEVLKAIGTWIRNLWTITS